MYTLEVCCGSLEDCLMADKAKADRIELNSGLYMGGLTPSMATVDLALQQTDIPIITMIRPRGGGFLYNNYEKEIMFKDAELFLKAGVHGVAFGFLDESLNIDQEATKRMVELCHKFDAEAVFHRAFDVMADIDTSIQALIDLKVDRVLTSGQRKTVIKGIKNLEYIQKQYGQKIEICAGSGVRLENVVELIQKTGILQIHGSFKQWYSDISTDGEDVSYRYSQEGDYDGVNLDYIKQMMNVLSNLD